MMRRVRRLARLDRRHVTLEIRQCGGGFVEQVAPLAFFRRGDLERCPFENTGTQMKPNLI
jgi:hypothetical protein